MELIIKQPTFPEIIEFNFNELKEEITKKTADYKSLVYADDQIVDAKKDVAALRKFTKALSDKRIEIKKECLKPYEDFEAKIKELDGIVNEAIQNIDSQVKAFEENKNAEKLEAIKEYFNSFPLIGGFESLKFEQIFDPKWLNASVSMKSIEEAISKKLEQIVSDLATLAEMPQFSFEATEVYKDTLDINKAITEGRRLSEVQKRKAEAERLRAEQEAARKAEAVVGTVTAEINVDGQAVPVAEIPVKAPEKQWVSFSALLSTEEALALKEFFNSRNIEFKAIRG